MDTSLKDETILFNVRTMITDLLLGQSLALMASASDFMKTQQWTLTHLAHLYAWLKKKICDLDTIWISALGANNISHST